VALRALHEEPICHPLAKQRWKTPTARGSAAAPAVPDRNCRALATEAHGELVLNLLVGWYTECIDKALHDGIGRAWHGQQQGSVVSFKHIVVTNRGAHAIVVAASLLTCRSLATACAV
jgi:hypothetical protein